MNPEIAHEWSFREAWQHLPWFGWVVACSPHLKALTTINVAGVQFDWLYYGLATILVAVRPSTLFLRFPFLLALTAALTLLPAARIGLITPLRSSVDIFSLLLIYSATYEILKRVDIQRVFDAYFSVSLVAASWGIFELFVGLNRAYGLDGLSAEPSHYVITAAPAAMYGIANQSIPWYFRALIPLSLLLTLSTTGLLVLAILVVFLMRKRLVLALAIAAVGALVWNASDEMRERVLMRVQDDAITDASSEFDFGSNRTTASMLSNWYVAKQNARDFFPFGVGYSNHVSGYEATFRDTPYLDSVFYGTNVRSGHNLSIRWLSEFGAFGIVVFAAFLTRILARRKRLSEGMWFIMLSAGAHFLGKSIKLGSYLDYGTPFFLCTMVVLLEIARPPRKLLSE